MSSLAAPRPLVFVSSVVDGFQEQREAARRGIERAGGKPILVNEDYPAMTSSPRNACLDGVDACDVFLLILGERGGWTAPSGKLVVEEEYEQALANAMEILVFVEKTSQDAHAEKFFERITGYVAGHFRQEFSDPEQLEEEILSAVSESFKRISLPQRDPTTVDSALAQSQSSNNETTARLVIAPERVAEVIDPRRLVAPSVDGG